MFEVGGKGFCHNNIHGGGTSTIEINVNIGQRRREEVEPWKECVAGCPVQKLESLQQWLHQLVQIDYVEDII